MSKIILDTNDTISIGAGSSDTSIYGGSGSEKVIVAATAASIYVDQSVERTELSGASTAYSYLISGNNLLVKSGTTTVATIIGGNGTKTIAFSDGSAPFAVTGVGVATLGGQSISASTAGTLTIPAAQLNTSDKSASAPVAATPTPSAGQTFTLTTGVDNLTGTTANDTFSATQTTFGASDALAGGTGTDTLNIIDNGTAAWTLPAANVSGIENINIRNATGTTTAQAQVVTLTVPVSAVNTDIMTVHYGSLSQVTAALTGTADAGVANATVLVATINALAGANIASNNGGVSATVTITAPTAGTALPTIGFDTATAVADIPAITYTTANVAATGGIDTVAAGNFVGATSFVSDNSTGGVTISGLGTGQALGINGNGSSTNGNLIATYKAGVTSTALSVAGGVVSSAVTVNGNADNLLTSLTINSTGSANTLTGVAAPAAVTTVQINADVNLTTGGITGVAAGTTITVSGAATLVDLGALAANATTVNASGLTGGIKATVGAVADTITGGAGNDTITTNGVLTGSVNAGTGTADKLIVAAAADVAATPAAKYTGFDILQNNATASIDASLIAGVTSVVLNASGAGFTNLSATQAGAVSATLTSAGTTLALANASGTTDIINLTGTTTTAATAVNLTSLVVTGVETLNYTNSATAASTLSLGGTGSTGLKTITVAGAKGVTLDIAAAATTPAHATTLTTISAVNLTAQATGTNTFTLQDTVGSHALTPGLAVTGSAGDDLFSFVGDTIASGVVQVSAGAGNDGLTATLAQLYTAGAGAIGFDGGANGTAGDTLTISTATAGSVSDSVFAKVTNVEKLAFSNTGAISLTSGGFFNAAFPTGVTITDGATTTAIVTFDLSLYSSAAKITNVGTTGAQSIVGGAGADTLIITSAVAATAGTNVVVKGGAGADTITIADASAITVSHAIDITGGIGADIISVSGVTNTAASSASTIFFNVAAGDSNVGAADKITGFNVVAAGSRLADTINFDGSAIKPAAGISSTAANGHTVSDLSFAVSTAGRLTFTGTSSANVTAADVEALWTAQISGLLNNLETIVWADANAADTAQYGNSLVFNHNTSGDSEVILVGVQATATGAAAATANLVGIG